MPTCDEIKKAVSTYNSENLSEDTSLRSALDATRCLPPRFGRFLAEVCLIADWGSFDNWNGCLAFPYVDRISFAERIESGWPILRRLQSRRAASSVPDAARLTAPLSRTDLLVPTSVRKRRELSFVSKYLHWCVNPDFPIWDRNARTALDYSYKDVDWESYGDWSGRVWQEVANHKACCLEQVRSSREHLVRTLDKALYVIGRGK